MSWLLLGAFVLIQEPQDPTELVVEPPELTLQVGDKATLSATVKDADGNVVERPVVFYSRRRLSVGVNPAGIVEAFRPGEHTLIAMVPKDPEDLDRRAEALLTVEIPVVIPKPPAASVAFVDVPAFLYEGTIVPLATLVTDTSGTSRPDIDVRLESSDPTVASLDELGTMTLGNVGRARITAYAESVSESWDLDVVENPAVSFELTATAESARTGDVVFFEATAKDARGNDGSGLPRAVRDLRAFRPTASSPRGPSGRSTPKARSSRSAPGSTRSMAVAGSRTRPTNRSRSRPATCVRTSRSSGRAPCAIGTRPTLWVWEAPNGTGLRRHGHVGRGRARVLLGRHGAEQHPARRHRPRRRSHRQ